ncbi:hypothetical protein [Methylocystis sp. S23]
MPKSPMRKSKSLLAGVLLISLAGCESVQQNKPVLKSEIKVGLSRICNVPLTSQNLERAARVVERYAHDPDVVGAIDDLDAQDQQARICRSMK